MRWFRNEELAEIFSAELRRQGHSPAWLSRRSGVSPATVARLFAGQRNPSASTLKRICDALGMLYDWKGNRVGVPDDHPLAREDFWETPGVVSSHILIDPPEYDQPIAAASWVELRPGETESGEVLRQGIFRVRISGACMEPIFPDGCTVEFRVISLADRQIEIGQPYYVQHADGRATFKLAYPAQDGLELRPLNRDACPSSLYVEWQNVARMARAVGIFTPIRLEVPND